MRRAVAVLAALMLALVWIGYLGAIRDPVETHYRVELAGLERPLRLVHLTDIHGSQWDMPEMRIARIVAQANALRPDVVVITGDFHSSKLINPKMRLEESLRPLMRLNAPLGVWSVPGNHDEPYWIRRIMKKFGLNLLTGDLVDLGPLQIVGSDDLILGRQSVGRFRAAAARADPGKPLIGLVHEPWLFNFVPPNVALLLAGHTHGGQIDVLGWPRATGFYETRRRGLFRNARGQALLISAGLGTTFVPMRIGVPPEIVVVELYPSGRNSGTER